MPVCAGLYSHFVIDATKQGALNDHYDEELEQSFSVSDYLRARAVWGGQSSQQRRSHRGLSSPVHDHTGSYRRGSAERHSICV
jgi:hypothetical protein